VVNEPASRVGKAAAPVNEHGQGHGKAMSTQGKYIDTDGRMKQPDKCILLRGTPHADEYTQKESPAIYAGYQTHLLSLYPKQGILNGLVTPPRP